MSDEWREIPVFEVASAIIGGTPARSVAKYWDGDIPWATASLGLGNTSSLAKLDGNPSSGNESKRLRHGSMRLEARKSVFRE